MIKQNMPRTSLKQQRDKTLLITNETELHCRVANYIRTYFSEEAIMAPGLGEIQDCQSKRIQAWRKGYQRGQPDIMLMNRSGQYSGLAIELKSPQGTGVVSVDQHAWMAKLQSRGWYTLISNDYTEVVHVIGRYMSHEKWICSACNHWTKRVHKHVKHPHTSSEHSEFGSECCSRPGAGDRDLSDTSLTEIPVVLSDSMRPHSVCSTCEPSVSVPGNAALSHSEVHNDIESV